MAIRLTTTLNKISFIPNSTNSIIIKDFYEYMKANGTLKTTKIRILKAMIVFANFLGSISLFDFKSKQQTYYFPCVKKFRLNYIIHWLNCLFFYYYYRPALEIISAHYRNSIYRLLPLDRIWLHAPHLLFKLQI
jgi:hypothetical protein